MGAGVRDSAFVNQTTPHTRQHGVLRWDLGARRVRRLRTGRGGWHAVSLMLDMWGSKFVVMRVDVQAHAELGVGRDVCRSESSKAHWEDRPIGAPWLVATTPQLGAVNADNVRGLAAHPVAASRRIFYLGRKAGEHVGGTRIPGLCPTLRLSRSGVGVRIPDRLARDMGWAREPHSKLRGPASRTT